MSDKDRTDQRMFSVFAGVRTDLRGFPVSGKDRTDQRMFPMFA
jgi:hypothetical protein